MRLRTIKKGARQGETFWGCTDYPKCDGTKRNKPSNARGLNRGGIFNFLIFY